jgi:hypothetical protein
MEFDVGIIPLGPREPARDDVIGGAFALRGSHFLERFPSSIKLAEPEGSRGEIELAIEVLGLEPRDLRPPRDCLSAVLFLTGLRQNVKRGQRIAVQGKGLARRVRRPIVIFPGQKLRSAL